MWVKITVNKTQGSLFIIGLLGLSLGIARADHSSFPDSPSRRRSQDRDRCPNPPPAGARDPRRGGAAIFPREFRTIDGSYNNLDHPEWGSAGIELLRKAPTAYGDGTNSPGGQNRPSPRFISNVCVAQPNSLPNHLGASDYLWQWGQFLDHDMDLTPDLDPPEPFNVLVPKGDPQFDPTSTGTQVIIFNRSFYRIVRGVREQINVNTAFIDASDVYGSDEARARELRALDGTGHLKTSANGLLPFNVNGLPNLPDTGASYFLAGDVRANEQVALSTIQTLFMREHNNWADAFHRSIPSLTDDQIYLMARAMVGAEVQSIAFREFLPLLLGPRAISAYRGYRPDVNPGIANEFSTAAYRVGHTLLSDQLLRLNRRFQVVPQGNLPLAAAFFNPNEVLQVGIDPVLRGLSHQACQECDNYIVDGVRNFLFGPPGAGGFDLASLNIQRGRDHGIASYNQARCAYGLRPLSRFADISSSPQTQAALAGLYGSPDNMDLWVGCLAEDHVAGAMVGPLIAAILKDQFERLRDGDRFWYEAYLPRELVALVEQQSLADIVRRNTDIGRELQDDVFRAPR